MPSVTYLRLDGSVPAGQASHFVVNIVGRKPVIKFS